MTDREKELMAMMADALDEVRNPFATDNLVRYKVTPDELMWMCTEAAEAIRGVI